jgi:hypothetical protein
MAGSRRHDLKVPTLQKRAPLTRLCRTCRGKIGGFARTRRTTGGRTMRQGCVGNHPLAAILCAFTLAACLSKPASAVQSGRVEGWGIPQANGPMVSDVRLPIGPGGGGPPGSGVLGPPINPKDYGMCGLTGLIAASSDNRTIIRIHVGADGYYWVLRLWWPPVNPPIVDWTCASLKEFAGLPDPATFWTMEPPPLSSSGTAGGVFNSFHSWLCIWAGVGGSISGAEPVVPNSKTLYGVSWVSYDGSMSVEWTTPLPNGEVSSAVTMLTTFTFCNRYSGTDHSWKTIYVADVPGWMAGGGGEIGILGNPIRASEHWCYLKGVAVMGGNSASVSLYIDPVSGNYKWGTSSGRMDVQCVAFVQ